MNAKQRLTVQSTSGVLHVVAIWQGLAPYSDKIGGVSAHVDAERGTEGLSIDVVDMCEHRLMRVAALLSHSRLPMTAIVEPVWPSGQALAPLPEAKAEAEAEAKAKAKAKADGG